VPILLHKSLLSHFEPPTKQQERLKEDSNTEIVNWDLIICGIICKIPIYCKKVVYLHFFKSIEGKEFIVLIK
jgi:hypothetical protein